MHVTLEVGSGSSRGRPDDCRLRSAPARAIMAPARGRKSDRRRACLASKALAGRHPARSNVPMASYPFTLHPNNIFIHPFKEFAPPAAHEVMTWESN